MDGDLALEPLDELVEAPSRGAPSYDFAEAVLAGLSRNQKSIPCRFFYDARGSELFEQITSLPEYYPTRVETELLRANAAEIAVQNMVDVLAKELRMEPVDAYMLVSARGDLRLNQACRSPIEVSVRVEFPRDLLAGRRTSRSIPQRFG